MKKRIIIPIEIEFQVDEALMGGKISQVKIYEKILTIKEIRKLYKKAVKNNL